MDEHDVVSTHHGILFSFTEEGILTKAVIGMKLEDITLVKSAS